MKKITLSFLTLLLAGTGAFAQITDTLRGDITGNKTLVPTKQYLLQGYVRVKSGAKLTIQAGTIIKGDFETMGTLIVEKGAKIFAFGTKLSPIVFTSEKAMGSRAAGDWGGVVLCGNAPTNKGTFELEGGYGAFVGGTDPNDGSGRLQYVRIEFAGIALAPNQEINGLTMGGVGRGTIIENVQVSYSNDDAFEWFGGTVNAKNLIAYKALDDDFDTDNGFQGKLQFGIGIKDKMIADVSKSNGFESDNDAAGSDLQPYTAPVFSNFSMVGPYATRNATGVNSLHENGAHLRRNTYTSIYNSYLAGFKNGIFMDGAKVRDNAITDSMKIKSTVVSGSPVNAYYNNTGWAMNTWFNFSKKDTTFPENLFLYVKDMFKPNAPVLYLKPTSRLLNGTIPTTFTGLTADPFFTPTSYVGAMGAQTTDWTLFWTEWNPQNHDYCLGCATKSREDLFFEDMLDTEGNLVQGLVVAPNPADNGFTTFKFSAPEVVDGMVAVIDLDGKEVTSFKSQFTQGVNEIGFATADLTTGIYVVKIVAGNQVYTEKFSVK